MGSIAKETLVDLYEDQQLSICEISKRLNVTSGKAFYWMLAHGMKQRTKSEAFRVMKDNGRRTQPGFGKREKNPNWKGGRRVGHAGYMMVNQPNHLRAHSTGYVLEHILIWEQVHNKPLPQGWTIHHLNGIKKDNRPENLLAMPHKRHANYISELKQRIRELEAKVGLLERAFEADQLMLRIEEN